MTVTVNIDHKAIQLECEDEAEVVAFLNSLAVRISMAGFENAYADIVSLPSTKIGTYTTTAPVMLEKP